MIDCLFIGHNEMDFVEYEKTLRNMGTESGAYRDLSLNFIRYNNRPYSVSEVFNAFGRDGKYTAGENKPLGPGRTFSASIAYLGTWLHRRGLTFDYINSFREQNDELAEKLRGPDILTVAVITTLYVSALPVIEIVEFVKKHNRTAKIIVGGPFVSTQVRTQDPAAVECLFKDTIGADVYVNSSQGEATLVEIIRALKNRLPLDRVNNIHYKTPGGHLAVTPVREEDNPLEENMVDWGLFQHDAGEFVAVRTAVSCPFSCAFCGYPRHAGKYRTAGVDAAEEELKRLQRVKSVKNIHFIDDTFNVPPKRFKEILRMMIRDKFQFKWHSYFRCQYADMETVELMKESGCEGVFLGIESGSDRILKNMNKAAEVESYLKGIALLKEYGIATFGNFIIGFPGETAETARETVEFITGSQLDFYRAQLWYYEHITPIWEQRETYDIRGESFNWSHRTMDAKTACDLVDDIFLTVEDPVWIPIFNFDFDALWHLVHRGMDIPGVKEFLRSFNSGVKEKLTGRSPGEVGYDVVKRLKNACLGTAGIGGADEFTGIQGDTVDDSDAQFDF